MLASEMREVSHGDNCGRGDHPEAVRTAARAGDAQGAGLHPRRGLARVVRGLMERNRHDRGQEPLVPASLRVLGNGGGACASWQCGRGAFVTTQTEMFYAFAKVNAYVKNF